MARKKADTEIREKSLPHRHEDFTHFGSGGTTGTSTAALSVECGSCKNEASHRKYLAVHGRDLCSL
jgi:hypothetical protein